MIIVITKKGYVMKFSGVDAMPDVINLTQGDEVVSTLHVERVFNSGPN